MTTIRVRQAGQEFTGDIVGSDKVASPQGGLQERLVVLRADTGTREYVLPEADGTHVEEVGGAPMPQADPSNALAHLAPQFSSPPGAVPSDPSIHVVGSGPPAMPPESMAPPGQPVIGSRPIPGVGSTIGGVPIQAPMHAPTPQPALTTTIKPERPGRFMVQPTRGKPTVFHTREDCSKVKEGSPRKGVSDEDIDFFDLEVCSSCQRRDSQISWAEAIQEVLLVSGVPDAEDLAHRVVAALKGNGFRVTPEVVER